MKGYRTAHRGNSDDYFDLQMLEKLIARAEELNVDALYAKKTGWSIGASSEIIGYGSGSVAKEYLPQLRHVGISNPRG